MNKEEILSQLDINKMRLQQLELRLGGGFNQDDGEEMFHEHGLLTNERNTLMQALNNHRLFTLNRTLSTTTPGDSTSLAYQCVLIAQDMTSDLAERYHRGKISERRYNNAHAAINHHLKFFTATTAHEFKTQITAAINEVLSPPASSQASSAQRGAAI